MIDFLFTLPVIELLSYLHHLSVLRFRSYSSAVFAGVDLFALKFYLDRVDPQQPFLASKNQTMGYRCIVKIKRSPP